MSANQHVLLIGSTGQTGRLLLTQLLAQSYTVTAIARNPASLDDIAGNDGLSIVKADPGSKNDMAAALSAAFRDAGAKSVIIVSTLGQTRASGSPWAAPTSPAMFMTNAIQTLIAAIKQLPSQKQAQTNKLVVMSMLGAGDSFNNLHWLIKPVMNYSNMMQSIDDHNGVDSAVRSQTDIKWTMVRPSMLKEGEARPVKVRNDYGSGEGWFPSSITMGSVVEFMINCFNSDEFVRRAPVITN